MKNRVSSIISLTKEGQWWNCWIKFLASFFSPSVSLSTHFIGFFRIKITDFILHKYLGQTDHTFSQ
jgi:hypothetical protein